MGNLTEAMSRSLSELLFLDIETVCCEPSYEHLSERLRQQWDRKSGYIDAETCPAELFRNKGAIYSEFGKIVTISLGRFYSTNNLQFGIKIKSLFDHNEKKLLEEFKSIVEKYPSDRLTLVAHNGKEFDFPYICRRMLINEIKIPDVLNLSGKKPWEVKHIDTMDFWKFGDRKHYTSLELLAALFDIPGSKSDMDGSQVSEVYYRENNLSRIADYCSQDVFVTASLFLKFNQMPLPESENIIFS